MKKSWRIAREDIVNWSKMVEDPGRYFIYINTINAVGFYRRWNPIVKELGFKGLSGRLKHHHRKSNRLKKGMHLYEYSA
jgi:hypothetical protein